MVVAVVERHLELDAPEERRGWMEDETVLPGVELRPELGDAAVVVGLTETDEVAAVEELDPDAARRLTAAGVEHVR